jgi:maleylacetate reductase
LLLAVYHKRFLSMPPPFIHDSPAQRIVFAPGAVSQIGEEAARLKFERVLVIATPGSGERLGARIVEELGARAAGLHARAVVHVPVAVAAAGVEVARGVNADGLVAAGGGSAIGLAKAIARETGLATIAIPTTYSGSEVTAVLGTTDGDRKVTVRDERVRPRTIIYDPDLTLALPPAVTAASGMNALAHCVEALWVEGRSPATEAVAADAVRRFADNLPRAVKDGRDRHARGECLAAAWLAGLSLATGSALHHKLAHVLGGYGLPHAETHAILLPHTTQFNLAAAATARARLADALRASDPAAALAAMIAAFPIPQRLRDVGLEEKRIADAAGEVGALAIAVPRPVSADDARAILAAAF